MRKIAVFIISFLIVFSCSDNNSIKIGVLFPLTGNSASYGEKGKKAIQMAIEEINTNGGIQGKQIEAIFEDSRADPTTGVTAAHKLISIHKVPAIIGDIVSSVTIPVAAVAERNQVVLVTPTSSAPAITDAGDYILP